MNDANELFPLVNDRHRHDAVNPRIRRVPAHHRQVRLLRFDGAEEIIEIRLTPEEQAAFNKSAAAVKELTTVIGV